MEANSSADLFKRVASLSKVIISKRTQPVALYLFEIKSKLNFSLEFIRCNALPDVTLEVIFLTSEHFWPEIISAAN